MRHGMFAAWVLLFALLAVAGCGSSTAPVHGKVTLADQTPVQGAIVSFEDPANHRSASGTTGADGNYELMSLEPGDGVAPGTYTVTVHQPLPADSSQSAAPRMFDQRYQDPSKSGLTCTVKPGDNVFDIVLDPP